MIATPIFAHWAPTLLVGAMEQQTHKAHRPAHSGAKADKKSKGKDKEKQHGFNEKVRNHLYSPCPPPANRTPRHLHPSLAAVQTGRAAGKSNGTRPVSMCLSSIVHPTTSRLQ